MPVVIPRAAELLMEVPIDTPLAAFLPAVAGVTVPADQRPAATASAVTPHARRARKKKMTPDARKARRQERRKHAKALSDASLFDPDQCRFSALLARLDEIAGPDDPPLPSAGDVEGRRGTDTPKPKTHKKS